MQNEQLPPIQPLASSPTTAPSAIPSSSISPSGRPMVQQVNILPKQKPPVTELVKTIAIITLSLISVTFLALFIWQLVEYNNISKGVQGEIDQAVAAARDEQAAKDEAEFLEREKYPYKTFSGPIDYGQLTFEYPKTWSVYVAAAATTGGDFNAYFNPVQVDAVGKDTINALRVTIQNKSFEEVTAQYQKELERKDTTLTMEAITVNNTPANRYAGNIPGTELSGFIVIFKIRDKTVIMQTDSVLFEEDFNKLIQTVTFNA